MRCANCGHENTSGLRFCEHCAQPLPQPERESAAVRTCPACSAANRPDVSFCEQCGTLLPASSAIEPAPPRVVHLPGPICPSCGVANRAGVRFCEHCGAALVGAGPAPARLLARRARRRTWLLVAVIGLLVLLILPLVASTVDVMSDTVRSRPHISQPQALELVSEAVVRHYPQLASITPEVHEAQFGRDTGYRIVYKIPVQAEAKDGSGALSRTVIFSINAVTEQISVVTSQ